MSWIKILPIVLILIPWAKKALADGKIDLQEWLDLAYRIAKSFGLEITNDILNKGE